jgi:ubiquinone/menaquinone biosynthesis C-methylase UbiE
MKNKFENPVRLQELKPEETLLRIGLQNGQIVCDIGAGSGIFTIPAATLTENTVFALEINDELIPVIREKAGALNLGNVQVLKVEGNDFGLETGSVDLALLVAIFHEISNKEQFLEEVVRILADHGKVAVIEFHKRDTPMGPPLSHRVSRNALLVHFEKAGSYLQEEFELGPNYYCAVLQKDSTRKKAGLY